MGQTLFPNLYIFLVGPPGVGKTVAIGPCAAVLRKSQVVHLAPGDVTKQGLIDALLQATKGGLTTDGRPIDYSYMTMYISELSNFMNQYDSALAGVLTALFDCEDVYDEQKRGISKDPRIIPFPGLSFIMGTATQNLGATISDAMWGSGFMARVILVYSSDAIKPSSPAAMFSASHKDEGMEAELLVSFRRIGELRGEMTWEPEAQDFIWKFWTAPHVDAPLHNRLANYNTRRWMHLAKLIMIAALADERMTVRLADCETALSWLIDAELTMPEIFKDMQTHEDGQIHEEMRNQFFQMHMGSGRKPISRGALIYWLSSRVASHSVERLLTVAIAADYFRRVAGTDGEDALYIPQMPKSGKDLGVM